MEIKNKKAYFEYTEVDSLIAGIVLVGTEIKSIRAAKASIIDSYCYFENGELFLKNSYIAKYDKNGYINHDERRERKLLLNKNELLKWDKKVQEKGMAIVPTEMFINENGHCKVKIMLCTGKKLYDKRQSLKEKDIKRDIEKEII